MAASGRNRPLVHSADARVPACRGDWAVAAGHVEAAEDAARTFGGFAEIFAASARSILGFARDDPGEALKAKHAEVAARAAAQPAVPQPVPVAAHEAGRPAYAGVADPRGR